MTLRSDHVAGGVFIALGILVFIIGSDLPFGTVSSPGAGMMPKLVASIMMICAGGIIAVAGRESPLLSSIDWSDRSHAFLVLLITAIAVALYQTLGFLITMSLLVFSLLVVIERRNIVMAAAYAVGLTVFAYWMFGIALKTPLERGLLWF